MTTFGLVKPSISTFMNRTMPIYTGLYGKWLLDTAIFCEFYKYKPKGKVWYEHYKKIYGITQITIGNKGNLNKIVVKWKDGSYNQYIYDIYLKGKLYGKSNNYIQALKMIE